jgi:hypothetical protein
MDVDKGERGAGEALRRKDTENAIRGIHARECIVHIVPTIVFVWVHK